MKAKKWLAAAVALTMVGSAAVGCSTAKKEEKGAQAEAQELNLYLDSEPPTMDLSKMTNNLSFLLSYHTNEGLTRLDKNGKALPGVAKEWKVSDDKLTYTFTLRDDAKWSDGSAVTAKDFEYSWKRSLDPATKAEYAFMVTWVKGGAAYNGGKGKAEDVAVKAVNDKTLEVKLENPIPFFIEQMAFPVFFPQKEEFVKKQGDKYGADADKALFNGPFKMESWTHEQKVVLVKNDSYWNKNAIKLNKVNFQVMKDSSARLNAFEAGQIDRSDLVRDVVDQYKGKPEFSVVPELVTGYLQFQEEKVPAFKNAKVRKAFMWAVDREQYADIIYHNGTTGAGGYVPTGTSNGAGGDFRKDQGDLIGKHTAEEAKKLLQEGLQELGLKEMPKVTLVADDSDVGKKAAEFLKEQFRTKLAYDINVENVPYKLRLKRSTEGQFEMVVSLWGADYNDPMTFVDMFVTNGSFNNGKWSNKKYDELIEKAQKETDAAKRMGYMKDAEKILIDEAGIAPIFFRGRAFVTKPYVKGFVTYPFGVDYDLSGVSIEGKKK